MSDAGGAGHHARGESAARSAAVRVAFESLGHVERGALELAHIGGLPVHEIAAALGRPPGDIRDALRSGLLRLGGTLREDAPALQP